MLLSSEVFRIVHLSLLILLAVGLLRDEVVAGVDARDAPLPRPVLVVEGEEDGVVVAGEGHVLVTWRIEENGIKAAAREAWSFELQQSRAPDFEVSRTRYSGRDQAVFVSGLPPGNSYFRVCLTTAEASSPWSEPLEVRVEYPSRGWVAGLLALGALVFALTVIAIVGGHFRSRREFHPTPE
jgi:hypothetical protein